MKASRLTYALATLAAGILFLIVVTYVAYPGYLEHGEATIAVTAWNLMAGIPAYHSFDSPDRTTNVYGPFTYLWHAWPVAIFGAGLSSSKIAGGVAALLVPVTAWAALRRDGAVSAALAGGLAAAFVLVHLTFPITIRPDSLLTALAGGAVWAALARARGADPKWSGLAIGACIGIAVNVKIHSGVYFAPAALWFALTTAPRHWLLPAATAAALALGPFFSPLFPPGDYLSWFAAMASKENTWVNFSKLWWHASLALLMPVAAWAAAGRRPDRSIGVVFAAYVACLLVMLFPATKIGANHHYYLPFAPTAITLAMAAARGATPEAAGRSVRALVAVLAVMLGLAWQPERRFFKRLEWDRSAAVVAEIEAIVADHPGRRIQMGVGGVEEGDPLTFDLYSWRNLLVYAGSPLTMDAGIVMELTKLGIPMPAAALERLRRCHTELWLVPKGERPFSLWGYYRQHVFDDAFRETFAATHVKLDSRSVFDVWECVGDPKESG